VLVVRCCYNPQLHSSILVFGLSRDKKRWLLQLCALIYETANAKERDGAQQSTPICDIGRIEREVGLMVTLTRKHIVFLYGVESLLFTRWPYATGEPVWSATNLIASISLAGIAALLCSFARLGMYGHDMTAQKYWQYTTTARKFAALVYYSSLSFVFLLCISGVMSSYCRVAFGRQQAPTYLATQLFILDSVFAAYVIVLALATQAGAYVLVYSIYYCFLTMYPEIVYMFTHFYFLALFPMLY